MKKYGITSKNLARWTKKYKSQEGIERKKGGGRKSMYLKMEKVLKKWCLEKLKISPYIFKSDIIRKAKKLIPNEKFRASQGWLTKFLSKNGITCIQKRLILRCSKQLKVNS